MLIKWGPLIYHVLASYYTRILIIVTTTGITASTKDILILLISSTEYYTIQSYTYLLTLSTRLAIQ